jgi:hypothetical protein
VARLGERLAPDDDEARRPLSAPTRTSTPGVSTTIRADENAAPPHDTSPEITYTPRSPSAAGSVIVAPASSATSRYTTRESVCTGERAPNASPASTRTVAPGSFTTGSTSAA